MPSISDRLATQYQQQYGRPADAADPAYAAYVRTAAPALEGADRANYDASRRRWGVADRLAWGATAIPFSAGLTSLFTGGGAAAGGSAAAQGTSAGYHSPGIFTNLFGGGGGAATTTAGTGATAANVGRMATLGRLFNSPGMGLAVNSGLSLLGAHSANRAAETARADQLAANREALALERQQLENASRNADLDREDARALNAAMNDLRRRELDAAEEDRAYTRSQNDARETRLGPYREASADALRALMGMFTGART